MIELVGGRQTSRLWLVRHGESTWNAAGRMQRQVAHPPLTARGLTQAYKAGYVLRGKGIEEVIASDAVRAMQTAHAIATVLGIDADVAVDARLRERGWAEVRQPVSTGGRLVERLEDPSLRIQTALADIDALGHPVAVVTHGDIICAILDMLSARDATTIHWTTGTSVPNGAVVGVRTRRPPLR